jgi:cysteine desulfurase
MSAHKIYGPKGVGALFVRGGPNSIPMEPIWYGGGQENGLRSGTMNSPGVVGFGEACSICMIDMPDEMIRIDGYRQRLENELLALITNAKINGFESKRLPNTSNITFPGIDADALILNAPQIMISTGSACTTGTVEPSHVLAAMGLSRSDASSSIRISFGRFNDDDSAKQAIRSIQEAYVLVS